MLKRFIGAALFALLLLPSFVVQAQSIKIGYVDPEVLIANMGEYRTVQQQIQQNYQQKQTALESMAQDLQEQVQKYQKQQPLLSETTRQQREQELMQLNNEVQQAAARSDQELAQYEQQLMEPIITKVETAINKIASAKGLDIVLRAPMIVYVNEDTTTNIMLDVAKELGIEVDEEAAAAEATGN
ncbi:MAG: OmpH family outer membrane protein [Bacteroidota bacterium]